MTVAPLTVRELIAFLQTQPQDLPVAYSLYSEYCLLEADKIEIVSHCLPRPDGWVQCRRPDMPTQDYLILT